MIRTRRAVVPFLAAGGVLAVSGCGATEQVAARVDGATISIDEFDRFTESIVVVPNFAPNFDQATGAVSGEFARSVLGLLITNEVAAGVLADHGEAITQADRDAVMERIGEQLADVPEDVTTAVVDSQARGDALGRIEVDAARQEQGYTEDPTSIGTFCVRHILTETEAEAEDVLARLADGEDFATLAAEVSIDPSAATNGGTLAGQGGASCMVTGEAAQTFDPTFFAAAAGAVPGSFVGPVATSFGWHVIEAIPYEEASEDIAALFDQYGGLMLYEGAMRAADVEIDPRYGAWNETSLAVVPLP